MRQYVVQPGDSPASIAARPDMAGCPKCSIDLVRSNPHKPAKVLPNGFVTFQSLAPGEVLRLPDKWFDGTLDTRPRAYFAALPYADGYTPSVLGVAAAGVLADYATLDEATALVGTLPSLDDASFSAAVPDTAGLIDSSIANEVGDMSGTAVTHAQSVRDSTSAARARNTDMSVALAAGDQQTVTQARLDIQNAFSTAISNARIALQAYYDGQAVPANTAPASAQMPSQAPFSTTLVAAAHAAVSAINDDSAYCASVARTGTPVNAAVHAFKTAWNASQPKQVPINTGNYETETALAIAAVVGSAPSACGVHSTAPNPPPPPPQTTLGPIVSVPKKEPMSTAAVAGVALLGAGAVYLAVNSDVLRRYRIRGVRRVRR